MSSPAAVPARLGDIARRRPPDTAHVVQDVEERTVERLDEESAIFAWRLGTLDQAGYDGLSAVLLASSRHVDLHLAVDLLDRGCPPDTALDILL